MLGTTFAISETRDGRNSKRWAVAGADKIMRELLENSEIRRCRGGRGTGRRTGSVSDGVQVECFQQREGSLKPLEPVRHVNLLV
jgi:hypothetical protein